MPAPEILKCMIWNPPNSCIITQQRESLAPVPAADIIAMPGSPMEEIESLRIDFVVKDGEVIRRP